MKFPTISVVFPNLNGANFLASLLNSVENSNYDKNKIEVILVDNGSTDKSIALAQRDFPKVKIIKLNQNLGFAAAVNLGVRESFGNYIFVTNNDTVLDKNCLINLASFAQNHPKVAVTGPIVFENQFAKPVKSLNYNFYTGLFEKSENLKNSDWITGAGMFFSKKLWRKLGGFDEGFFFTFEDLDFCLRAKKLGFKITHCPKAEIWHKVGSTVNRPNLVNLKYYESYKSKLRLLLKHGSFPQIISAFLLQFFVFAPYRLLVLKEKSLIPLFQALIWNLKHLGETLNKR